MLQIFQFSSFVGLSDHMDYEKVNQLIKPEDSYWKVSLIIANYYGLLFNTYAWS